MQMIFDGKIYQCPTCGNIEYMRRGEKDIEDCPKCNDGHTLAYSYSVLLVEKNEKEN